MQLKPHVYPPVSHLPNTIKQLGRGGYYIYPSARTNARNNPSSQFVPNQVDKLTQWQRGDVAGMARYADNLIPLGSSGQQAPASASDARLGSLWVLTIALRECEESGVCFGPGDLLAIRNGGWSDGR